MLHSCMVGMQLPINGSRTCIRSPLTNSRRTLLISCRAGGTRSRDSLPNARRRSPPPQQQQQQNNRGPDYEGPTDAEV